MTRWAAVRRAAASGGERLASLGMIVPRTAAAALLAAVTLSGNGLLGSGRSAPNGHPALVLAALAACEALVVGWAVMERVRDARPGFPTWLLPSLLLLLSVISGAVSMLPIAGPMVGFTLMAAVAAGADLETGPACAVAASGVLAIAASSLAFGFTTGAAVGWPLGVLVAVLVGRSRRDVRIQRAQAAALVAQAERTRSEEQRAATLDERARIAREIHDLLAHSLGALGIQLEAALALLAEDGDVDRGVQLVGQARRLAASGLAETRQAIEALRADSPPLDESLAALVRDFCDVYHPNATLRVDGLHRPVSAEVTVALSRVTDEALTNAAKHAPGAPVDVQLVYDPDRITVTVTDTPSRGVPSDRGSAPASNGAAGGYGLIGMRERLMLIGGTLTAGPDGDGWTVRAQVPR
ncbi:hypothetical protein K6U06_20390 [Acidiferrimicrobium sp. IK]|uniref:sensor histidine kinase n=1 Tax=Acidiferrimicrobium sp. IK TaxID=2871700 RepID=UPI0021CB2205|nr:histidine kinase [Acidiferrimicrobium sp. IK]MCU4186735.1 hypothetical protein [Acidiferrimicrobium sp. IK]